ncbi:MAG TPA: cupredoxin family copper-binding protein [Terriglobales bacterium]|nr:cupredoxin family copper-binding protein [Terriglobales bacterium]
MKKIYSIALVLGLTAGLILARAAGHGRVLASAAPQSATTQIKIDNFSFAPLKVSVRAGTTVQWTNRDDIPHTVVSEDNATFKSQVLDTDQEFTYTFRKPGTYRYYCSLHPRMAAEIVVGE